MIKVLKEKNKITISGHAGYSEHGKDIVCASVSSIVYTTVNAIKSLGKNVLLEDKDVMIITYESDETSLKLIDNMISLLKSIETDYPKNIIVKEN